MNKIKVRCCFFKNNLWFIFIFDILMKGIFLFMLIIKCVFRVIFYSYFWIVNFSCFYIGLELFYVDLKI